MKRKGDSFFYIRKSLRSGEKVKLFFPPFPSGIEVGENLKPYPLFPPISRRVL